MRGRWAAGWRKRRELFLSSDSGRIESEPGGEKGIKKPEARLSGCLHCEPPASPAVSPSSRQGPRGPPTPPPVRHLYGRSKGRGRGRWHPLFSRGPSAADQSPIPGGKAGGHTHTHPVPRNLPSQQQQSPGNFPGPARSKQTCFIPLTAA